MVWSRHFTNEANEIAAKSHMAVPRSHVYKRHDWIRNRVWFQIWCFSQETWRRAQKSLEQEDTLSNHPDDTLPTPTTAAATVPSWDEGRPEDKH